MPVGLPISCALTCYYTTQDPSPSSAMSPECAQENAKLGGL